MPRMPKPDLEAARAEADAVYKELMGVRPAFSDATPMAKPKIVNSRAKQKPLPVTDGKRQSPVTAYVKSLGKDLYSVAEVAKMLGVSTSLIRKYAKLGVADAPSYEAPFGQYLIRLYTKDDVKRIKAYMNDRGRLIPRNSNA